MVAQPLYKLILASCVSITCMMVLVGCDRSGTPTSQSNSSADAEAVNTDVSTEADTLAQLVAFDPQEVLQGGATTVKISSAESYSKPAANLPASRKGDFFVGNALFKQPWVIAPASTDSRDGLGGLFNVAACQSCHIKDGRGHAPIDDSDTADSLLIRLAMLATTAEQKLRLADPRVEKLAHPVYGGQLQDRGVPNVPNEANVKVAWQDKTVTFADGYKVTLRQPRFALENLNYGKLPDSLILSPRVALPMIGLGLLEQIKAEDILAQQDIEDNNQDGISGKANQILDPVTNELTLGRFGWKAGQGSILGQNMSAFNEDMGLTSKVRPHESCTPSQQKCIDAALGNDPITGVEVSDDIAKVVEFYARNLAVPARRHADQPKVLAGKKHFYTLGCVSCHTPRYQLPVTDDDHLEQHGQIIYPYTDLLLHDMGEGLADYQVDATVADDSMPIEYLATGREWRTPALWGIGLAQTVSKEATFLHDGRARTLMEAMLWHGGEAQSSRDKVLQLDAQERAELDAFLNSL